MKYLIIITTLLIGIQAFAQKKQSMNFAIEGYRFDHKIKGPKHKNSKVLEIMVGNNGNYVVASYAGPKRDITVNVHNLYTWELVGSYQFKGRAELYNSYFDEIEPVFYVNSDIFRNLYKKINIKTHVIEEIGCVQTPRGCKKMEAEIYQTELYTIGENYYINRDDERKNYIKIYKKKELFIDDMDYLEGDNGSEDGKGELIYPEDSVLPQDTTKTEQF